MLPLVALLTLLAPARAELELSLLPISDEEIALPAFFLDSGSANNNNELDPWSLERSFLVPPWSPGVVVEARYDRLRNSKIVLNNLYNATSILTSIAYNRISVHYLSNVSVTPSHPDLHFFVYDYGETLNSVCIIISAVCGQQRVWNRCSLNGKNHCSVQLVLPLAWFPTGRTVTLSYHLAENEDCDARRITQPDNVTDFERRYGYWPAGIRMPHVELLPSEDLHPGDEVVVAFDSHLYFQFPPSHLPGSVAYARLFYSSFRTEDVLLSVQCSSERNAPILGVLPSHTPDFTTTSSFTENDVLITSFYRGDLSTPDLNSTASPGANETAEIFRLAISLKQANHNAEIACTLQYIDESSTSDRVYRARLQFSTSDDALRSIVAVAPSRHLPNIAAITGVSQSLSLDVLLLSHAGAVNRLNDGVMCFSETIDVVKATTQCTLHFDGTETYGAEAAKVYVSHTLSGLKSSATLTVWFPEQPVIVRVAPAVLRPVASWHTRLPNSRTCTRVYEYARVLVTTRFKIASPYGGQVQYVAGMDHNAHADVTRMLTRYVRVNDSSIANLFLTAEDQLFLRGLRPGVVSVDVIVSDRIIGSAEVEVVDEPKTTASALSSRAVSHLGLQIGTFGGTVSSFVATVNTGSVAERRDQLLPVGCFLQLDDRVCDVNNFVRGSYALVGRSTFSGLHFTQALSNERLVLDVSFPFTSKVESFVTLTANGAGCSTHTLLFESNVTVTPAFSSEPYAATAPPPPTTPIALPPPPATTSTTPKPDVQSENSIGRIVMYALFAVFCVIAALVAVTCLRNRLNLERGSIKFVRLPLGSSTAGSDGSTVSHHSPAQEFVWIGAQNMMSEEEKRRSTAERTPKTSRMRMEHDVDGSKTFPDRRSREPRSRTRQQVSYRGSELSVHIQPDRRSAYLDLHPHNAHHRTISPRHAVHITANPMAEMADETPTADGSVVSGAIQSKLTSESSHYFFNAAALGLHSDAQLQNYFKNLRETIT